MAAALLAMAVANSPMAPAYETVLQSGVRHWINDGLMVLFFLLVGVEIARETTQGELAGWRKSALPVIGAVGGVLLPALIYLLLNPSGEAARGWATGSATDIAFSLGVLALLGSCVPSGLKIFLMAVAVIDDLIAVLIIAFFYSSALNLPALALAAVLVLALLLMRRLKVARLASYLLCGLGLWLAVLHSGVHATVAGVLLGCLMPPAAAEKLESKLHLWVAYGVMPVFAVCNAGVPLEHLKPGILLQPVPLGIALGLFAGKQLGIFAACRLAVALGIGRLPEGTGWASLYGVSMVAGIGFTMSLFIGTLAFANPVLHNEARLGVMVGSVASALLGYVFLRCVLKKET